MGERGDRDRRTFLKRLGWAAGAAGLLPPIALRRFPAAPSSSGPDSVSSSGPASRAGVRLPVAIASGNGAAAVEHAITVLRETGDTLEAVVGGVGLVEADPEDSSVGYGGLPNAAGAVQLDSQVWHGPTRGVGAVAALEGYMHPSRVAVAVMRYTDHVLLLGEGASRFAAEMGFESRDLLTAESRRRWLAWRAGLSDGDDYLTPEQSHEPVDGFPEFPADSHDGVRPGGTIHCAAVNAAGEISAATTTSGLAFKVPGRVGDSPLPGCGCCLDPEVGVAGATGRGEAVMKTVGAHAIVEAMRGGAAPTDACLAALRRIVDWSVEDRLLGRGGRPNFNVTYYAVNRRGEHGAAALWAPGRYVVDDGEGARPVDGAYLFERGT